MPLAADVGLSFADPWAVGLAFLGLAVFAAVGALSHQRERAFSASLIYLGLGVVGAAGLAALGVRWLDPVRTRRCSSTSPSWRSSSRSSRPA